ncbi:hypothetical protein PISMIDRAFT_16416 [Pisolithus microcarpus 441]|uniref:Reverse transcriptase RNase H-like domain-containing protein n=1 Tax=Pisolithus microcarpus 441 TaxID=765257 RepID=A0A0C9YZU8_9AGAM|nr:hypothetical protein PISMIDRAFT_16416 [Pisolithus microcarpus 441]
MDPVKVQGIAEWPTPKKVKDVRSFLGFTNFYWHFICNYSNVARPLIDLTKKDALWEWSSKANKAFETLKKMFMLEPVLKMPDPSKLFAISADALNLAHSSPNCSTLQKETMTFMTGNSLRVIQALKTWCHYLQGAPSPVLVLTDHKNLTYFREPQNLNCQQARWLLDLADFDLKFQHIPGKELCVPDALSHRPDHIDNDAHDNEGVTLLPQNLFVQLINTSLSEKVASSSASDLIVLTALQAIELAEMPPPFKSNLSDWHYKGGVLFYKDHAYVPDDPELCCTVVSSHHDHPSAGHPSVLKTCLLVSTKYWWPGVGKASSLPGYGVGMEWLRLVLFF